MEERMDYLKRIMYAARLRGLCNTQKDFARKLGIDPSALSSAMNGNERFLTNSLIGKVKAFAEREGLETAPERGKTESIEVPVAFKEMLDNLSSVLKTQADMLALYQAKEMALPLSAQKKDSNHNGGIAK